MLVLVPFRFFAQFQNHLKTIMAGQPTPPNVPPPPRNKGLIRLYFWGGMLGGLVDQSWNNATTSLYPVL